jgi:hypothetical protein
MIEQLLSKATTILLPCPFLPVVVSVYSGVVSVPLALPISLPRAACMHGTQWPSCLSWTLPAPHVSNHHVHYVTLPCSCHMPDMSRVFCPPPPHTHTHRLRAWYPVAIVSQLDPARPSHTQLLGRQMVIWHNPKTKL